MATRRLSDHTNTDIVVRSQSEGGFGVVYFGPDRLANGSWAALKTLQPKLVRPDDPSGKRIIEFFVKESLTWMSLWPHANILPARGVTIIENQVFLVLQYAEGGSLYDWLRRQKRAIWPRRRAPFGQRLYWAQMIVAGLEYLHSSHHPDTLRNAYVHGDLTPANVLIQSVGLVQLTDFGLARGFDKVLKEEQPTSAVNAIGSRGHSSAVRTRYGNAYGVAAYMAPEQWTGEAPVDTYTDMYAFGLILSELLADQYPLLDHQKVNPAADSVEAQKAWQEAHLHGTPKSLNSSRYKIPALVERLYERCLSKQPSQRPSAQEALRELRQAADSLGHRPYEAPDVFPHTPEHERTIWHGLANTYARFYRYNEAMDWNDAVLKQNPQYAPGLLTRANILSENGHSKAVETVVQAYHEALAAIPSSDQKLIGGANFSFATYLGKRDLFSEAEDAFKASLAAQPDSDDVWCNRGVNEMQWGRSDLQNGDIQGAIRHFDRGIEYLRKARKLNPRDPSYSGAVLGFEKLRDIVRAGAKS